MFVPIQQILPKAAQRLGVRREVEAALICEKYRKLAPELIHAQALQYTMPKFFKGKTLTIAITDPAWAAHLMARKSELVAALNDALGEKVIEKIATKLVEFI